MDDDLPGFPRGPAALLRIRDGLDPRFEVAPAAQREHHSGPAARLEDPVHARPPDGEERGAPHHRLLAPNEDDEPGRRSGEGHETEYEPAPALSRVQVGDAGHRFAGYITTVFASGCEDAGDDELMSPLDATASGPNAQVPGRSGGVP